VRVLDTVLFDSGKAKLRKEAYAVLDRLAEVLNNQAMSQPIAVEGHTDNEPIRHSGWKDNWELSLARARSVLTYLVQAPRNVAPTRISAVGHGEYRPIASNDTADGRRTNRRVEIVVLPRGTTVSAPADAREASRGTSAYQK
jgi:chemotaxis protein MotB